jgi:hypothetical protein
MQKTINSAFGKMIEAGILDTRYWMLDARYWIFVSRYLLVSVIACLLQTGEFGVIRAWQSGCWMQAKSGRIPAPRDKFWFRFLFRRKMYFSGIPATGCQMPEA